VAAPNLFPVQSIESTVLFNKIEFVKVEEILGNNLSKEARDEIEVG